MKVGIVGWRGMVGSVLMQRMQEENDLAGLEPVFFSTSQAGQEAPTRTVSALSHNTTRVRSLPLGARAVLDEVARASAASRLEHVVIVVREAVAIGRDGSGAANLRSGVVTHTDAPAGHAREA